MSNQHYNTTSASHSGPSTPDDDWSGVSDPNERRKIQNRIAQRKFREKARQQRRLDEQLEENARLAGAAYTSPNPKELDVGYISGPPWGSISLKHVLETGWEKQQSTANQSLVTSAPHATGSSRPGLHLIDNYARGNPAWTTWRIPRAVVKSTSSIDTDASSLSERQ